MRLKRTLTLIVTLGLAAFLLWVALRDVEWGRVGATLRDARWGPLALSFVAASVAAFLRSERWRILLKAEGAVPVGVAFWATALGYCGNNFLPARLGELVRMRAISAKTSLGNSYVLATALTERLLDAGVLVLASCCALLALSGMPAWLQGAARTMAIGSGIGVGVILILPRCERSLTATVQALPFSEGLRSRICRLLSNFLLGMRSFHHTGRALRFLGLTAVVWSIDGIAAVWVADAISVPLSFPEGLLVVAALGLSSALPSTPGSVGIYQFVAVTVMAPLGISNNDAVAFIFLYQGIVVCTLAAWGLIGAWRLGRVSWFRGLRARADSVAGDA